MSDDTNKDNPVVAETSDHEPSLFTVTVRDTFTGTEKEVEVSERVYNEFRRGEWRIEKDDSKNDGNTIPFSSIIPNDNSTVDDRISEIADLKYSPELYFEIQELRRSVMKLKPDERDLIISLYYQGMSSRDYAKKIKRSQTWVQKKKWKILKKIKNFLV